MEDLHNSIDDELERLVSSSSDTTSQYVIFRNGRNELFGINVMKVEGLIKFHDINFIKNSKPSSLILGVAKIRGNMIHIVNFDRWMDISLQEDYSHDLLMLCNYGNHLIGLVIKSVFGVISIDHEKLEAGNKDDEKMAYVSELLINREQVLCTIFDSDRLLMDIFKESDNLKETDSSVLPLEKQVVFIEDSRLIQQLIEKFANRNALRHLIFNNGQEALEKLESVPSDDIALIITDIEMPKMDGLRLIEALRSNETFCEIPIIVHSNMANDSITGEAKKRGANHVVNKVNFDMLAKVINEYALQ